MSRTKRAALIAALTAIPTAAFAAAAVSSSSGGCFLQSLFGCCW